MPRKTPLSVYLDPSLLRDLDVFAAERRKPRSLVIEAAIRSFLTPDDADRREAAIARRGDAASQSEASQHMENLLSPPLPRHSAYRFHGVC